MGAKKSAAGSEVPLKTMKKKNRIRPIFVVVAYFPSCEFCWSVGQKFKVRTRPRARVRFSLATVSLLVMMS